MPRNPTDDLPSTCESQCDLGGCSNDWAWETQRRHGKRNFRLCEEHADVWLRSERELVAEREEVAGRDMNPEWSALFGLSNALDRIEQKFAHQLGANSWWREDR